MKKMIMLIGFCLLFTVFLTKSAPEPFTISERTIYEIDESIVYVEITENLGKDQIINVSSIFVDNVLTRDISYESILLNQSYQKEIHGLLNTSLGKYKTTNISTECEIVFSNETQENVSVCVNTTHYYDNDGYELTCSFILPDKTCLSEIYGTIGHQTAHDYLPIPNLKEKTIIGGQKIEMKQEGIPLPKNSKVQLKYTMRHPISFMLDVPESVNKYNITVSSMDGSDISILDPTWFDENWGKKRNFTITVNDYDYNYDNYFMNVSFDTATEISGGDMQNDCADIRIVDNNNNSLDYKLINCNDADTRLWFNFTNATPTTTDYQIYYSHDTVSQPTDYNFSHWTMAGDDFDQMTAGIAPDTWTNTAGNNVVVDENDGQNWSYSGTFSGNRSYYIDSTGNVVQRSWGAIATGKVQFVVNITANGADSSSFFTVSDAAAKTVVDFRLGTNVIQYNDGSDHTIAESTGGVYYYEAEWGADKWNFTMWNSTWSYSNNSLAKATSGAGAATNIRRADAASGDIRYIDDLIIRDTGGVWNEPSCEVSGTEDSVPIRPQFFDNTSNYVSPNYTTGRNYGFEINWTDADSNFDYATFESNFTGSFVNYTNSSAVSPVFNNSIDLFHINFTQEQFSGAYLYHYMWHGNDTSPTYNQTDWITYEISQGTPTTSGFDVNDTYITLNQSANITVETSQNAIVTAEIQTTGSSTNYTLSYQSDGNYSLSFNKSQFGLEPTNATRVNITYIHIDGTNYTLTSNSTSLYIDYGLSDISTSYSPSEPSNSPTSTILFTTRYNTTENDYIGENCTLTLNTITHYMDYSSGTHTTNVSTDGWSLHDWDYSVSCTNASYETKTDSGSFTLIGRSSGGGGFVQPRIPKNYTIGTSIVPTETVEIVTQYTRDYSAIIGTGIFALAGVYYLATNRPKVREFVKERKWIKKKIKKLPY